MPYISIENKYSEKSKLYFKFLFSLKNIGIEVSKFNAVEIQWYFLGPVYMKESCP